MHHRREPQREILSVCVYACGLVNRLVKWSLVLDSAEEKWSYYGKHIINLLLGYMFEFKDSPYETKKTTAPSSLKGSPKPKFPKKHILLVWFAENTPIQVPHPSLTRLLHFGLCH